MTRARSTHGKRITAKVIKQPSDEAAPVFAGVA